MHTRLPIKCGLFSQILNTMGDLLDLQPYLLVLYQVMLTTAYFGLFRIGEICFSDHTVKARDVQLGENKPKLMFILCSSKTHCKGNKPQIIKISGAALSGSQTFCPFLVIKHFVNLQKKRLNNMEQFFIFNDHSPVCPHHFRAILSRATKNIGLDSSLYGSHSLRSGRAIELMEMGVSVETIKKIGQWKSNAVFTYLS